MRVDWNIISMIGLWYYIYFYFTNACKCSAGKFLQLFTEYPLQIVRRALNLLLCIWILAGSKLHNFMVIKGMKNSWDVSTRTRVYLFVKTEAFYWHNWQCQQGRIPNRTQKCRLWNKIAFCHSHVDEGWIAISNVSICLNLTRLTFQIYICKNVLLSVDLWFQISTWKKPSRYLYSQIQTHFAF